MFTYLGHIFAFLAAVLVLAVVVYTRDRGNRHTFVYFFDVEQPHESFPPDVWQKLSAYLESKDCPLGAPEIFNGHDIADCDAKCRDYLKQLTARLSKEELAAILGEGAGESTLSFHYCAWRHADPDHPDRIDPVTGETERIVFSGVRI